MSGKSNIAVSTKRSNRQKIDELTTIKLWTASGGRCEFKGCNEYLLLDNLTREEANFSDRAHVVPVKDNWERGDDTKSDSEKNSFQNLMLVCKKHHKLIDDKKHKGKYSTDLLAKYKKEHEDRIFQLTGITDESKTIVIRLRGRINGEPVTITQNEIKTAILPKYMADDNGIDINLTTLPVGDDDSYWSMGQKIIDQQIASLYAPSICNTNDLPISVFALAPIPFLVYLGSKLSSARHTDLFQFHKDKEDWVWKDVDKIVKFQINLLKKGKDESSVVLFLSLSGSVKIEDLPTNLCDSWVYEITLQDSTPSKFSIRNKEDLVAFREIYRQFLSEVRKEHKKLKEISIFPAVPPPVALTCGRDLIKKTDPSLIIYDFNKKLGGFRKILNVN